MSISTEEKDRYLRETAIVLAREGFQTGKTDTGKLRVLLDGAPLCEVTENGGIAYRNEDINEPERVAAKDMVYEIVRNTAEYMRQMETAPFLKADGLEDGYKVLADFNGTVLAGVQSKHGVHFVTWDWAYGHTGVCHGHYFMENYAGAKQDLDMEYETLSDLNELAEATDGLSNADMEKLGAVVMLAEPKSAAQIKNLAESLDLFDFAPGAHSPAEYGRYMIRQSGHFDYDENLDAFYDYEKYGTERMNEEDGMFTDRGYIAYKGYTSMEEVMNGSQSSHMEMGGLSR